MPFLQRKQDAAARFATALTPRTALGLMVRNVVTRLLAVPFVADRVLGSALRNDLILPDYRAHGAPRAST
jgi:hypothetical protein